MLGGEMVCAAMSLTYPIRCLSRPYQKRNGCGRVHEFAVDVARDGAHVSALILRRREGGKLREFSLPIESLEQPSPGATRLTTRAAPTLAGEIGDFLLL